MMGVRLVGELIGAALAELLAALLGTALVWGVGLANIIGEIWRHLWNRN